MTDTRKNSAAPPKSGARRARAQHVPNVERSIAQAIMAKDGELFLVADRHGDMPLAGGHGYGLFFHDCRYLSGYALAINDEPLIPLSAANRGGSVAEFRLTNRDMRLPCGTGLAKQTLGVGWTRLVRGADQVLHDVITVRNFGHEAIVVPVEVGLKAEFDDIFQVRSLGWLMRGDLHAPRWEGDVLAFSYAGADAVTRHLRVRFSRPPASREASGARFELALGPQAEAEIAVELAVYEDHDRSPKEPKRRKAPEVRRALAEARDAWRAKQTRVASNSILLGRVLERNLDDLHALKTPIGDAQYFAAGLPWYGTLFGRDSLITALQMLAYDPAIAATTLKLLAGMQGEVTDAWRDEAPGKILHEHRQGELAAIGAVPFGRYFGTVDATPLFLVLLAEHARWTGSLALFDELRPNVERALAWIEGACDADGFLAYAPARATGLPNQGWKDSDDAIVDGAGALAQAPIALVEVQGYVYRALTGLAELYDRAGEPAAACKLRGRAARLRRAFERAFWVPAERCYALARHAGGVAGAVASNAGQALWGGIASKARAGQVAKRLVAPDMFSGWGVRTLSERSPRYNPLGYHLGTVWPHDNALVLMGLRQYGHDAAAMQVFMGMFDAASAFPQYRLPELFSGYPREGTDEPVAYPVACHPQAWAAGALPAMLASLLGLRPDGFANVLNVERPLLPPFVDRLELHGLRVGKGCVSLRFERTAGGVGVGVLRSRGGLTVRVEPTRGS